MALSDLIKELETRVQARWTGEGAGKTLQFSSAINRAGKVPRITWEPVAAEHQPPSRMGGGPKDDGVLWRRQLGIVFHIWGEDYDQADELMGIVVSEAHDLWSQRSMALAGEQWETGDEVNHGVQVDLTIRLTLPFLRKPAPTRTITAIVPTYDLDGETV